MNILVIAPTPYFSDRGCHIRILEEITALKKAGHVPVLYTYHLGRDVGDVQIYRSASLPWYKKTAAGPSWHKPYIDILLLWKILRTARKQSFDIIHAHLHEGAWIGWWVKLYLRKPLILDAQGSLVGEMEAYNFFRFPGLRKFFWLLERWIINRADYIFTSSQATFDFIKEHFPTSQSHLALLSDAVSTLQPVDATTANNTRALRAKLSIGENVPVIMYTGGLSKIKGIDILLNALPLVMKKFPEAVCVIVGYPEVERCQQIINELGIGSQVRFVGQVNYFQLSTYLQLANVAVDPKPTGSGEASGKLLNYMAAGLAVVAFDSVNARAMMGETGVLAKLENPESLAEAITYALSNKDEQARLGKAARERIEKQFSWNERIKIATSVYETITKK